LYDIGLVSLSYLVNYSNTVIMIIVSGFKLVAMRIDIHLYFFANYLYLLFKYFFDVYIIVIEDRSM
jgi:hypothetical protein